MKATVVVSCFNQEQYIEECLNSILTQKTDFDFDVLIADDCSTDSTFEIIQGYKNRYDQRLNLIVRTKNLGAAGNYIDAHKQASGEIIFHIDGDDVMLPGKLQKQFDLFRHHDKVNLVFHRAQYFSDDGTYLSDTGSPYASDNGLLYFTGDDLARWGSITVHSAYAYRKTSRQFLRPNTEFMEWFFAMDSLLPEGLGVYIDEVLVKYRCNLSGTSYLSTKKGRKKAYNIYLNDVFYYFSLYPNLRKNLYSNVLVTAGGMAQNRFFSTKVILFLIRKITCFDVKKFKNTWKMRRAVTPMQRIR